MPGAKLQRSSTFSSTRSLRAEAANSNAGRSWKEYLSNRSPSPFLSFRRQQPAETSMSSRYDVEEGSYAPPIGLSVTFKAPTPSFFTESTTPAFSFFGEYFHVMISYRVATEGDQGNGFALQLYKEITSASLVKPFPRGTYGRWPTFAKKPENLQKGQAKVYLDIKCLKDGEPWVCGKSGKGGFIGGIFTSVVFVPVLSWYNDADGSVGGLTRLDPEGGMDYVDNVLLEWLIVVYLFSKQKGAMRSITPILMGMKGREGRYDEFPFHRIQQLKDVASKETNKKGLEVLKLMGAEPDNWEEEAEFLKTTIQDVVKRILQHQAVMLSNEGIHSKALEAASDRVLNSAHSVLQEYHRQHDISYNSIQAFEFHKPQGHEVMEWLTEHRIRYFGPVFARNKLDSLHLVSQLDRDQIARLETQTSREAYGTSESQEDAEQIGKAVELITAVKALQHDRRAQAIKTRMTIFQDVSASPLASVISWNAMETTFSSWTGTIFVVLLAISHLLLGITAFVIESQGIAGYLKEPFEWKVIEPPRPLWFIYWPGSGACLVGLGFLANLVVAQTIGSRYCRWIVVSTNLLWWTTYWLKWFGNELQCNIEGNGMGPFCNGDLFKRAALGGIFSTWLMVYVEPLYFLAVFISAGSNAPQLIPYYASFGTALGNTLSSVWVAILIYEWTCCFIVIGAFLMAQVKARFAMKTQKRRYDMVWKEAELREEQNINELKANCQQIDEIVQQDRRAELGGPLSKAYLFSTFSKRRYTLRGKTRQKTDDISSLFELAQNLSFDFQAWVSTWCRVGVVHPGPVKHPQRAIQKAVRSYGRDAACLTDLVRCAVVVANVADLNACIIDIVKNAYVVDEDINLGHSNPPGGEERNLMQDSPQTFEDLQEPEPADEAIVLVETVSVPVEEHSEKEDLHGLAEADDGVGMVIGNETRTNASVIGEGQAPSTILWTVQTEPSSGASASQDPSGVEFSKSKMMRIVSIKNRMTPEYSSASTAGYRDVTLLVEVGWIQHHDICEFISVDEWTTTAGLCTLVCEIQIITSKFWEIKNKIGHDSYIKWRNSIAR